MQSLEITQKPFSVDQILSLSKTSKAVVPFYTHLRSAVEHLDHMDTTKGAPHLGNAIEKTIRSYDTHQVLEGQYKILVSLISRGKSHMVLEYLSKIHDALE